jgi:S-adenosylmethionine hydrolase
MLCSIITLTTDFGLKDPYVAEMKAVILTTSPKASIVDITHEVEKFNVKMGAYILAAASTYFPKGTIHVAVVDPGVGTKRQPIVLQTEKSFFVGPDNGLLALAARSAGTIKQIRKIANKELMLPKVSNTFHGRDIFAPVAAHLANGKKVEEFGPKLKRILVPTFAEVVKRGGMFVGEVIHVDAFGNIITNLGEKELELAKGNGTVDIGLGNRRLRLKLCKAYGEVDGRNGLVLIGSHGFLEIAINQGKAAEVFAANVGDEVTLHHSGSHFQQSRHMKLH